MASVMERYKVGRGAIQGLQVRRRWAALCRAVASMCCAAPQRNTCRRGTRAAAAAVRCCDSSAPPNCTARLPAAGPRRSLCLHGGFLLRAPGLVRPGGANRQVPGGGGGQEVWGGAGRCGALPMTPRQCLPLLTRALMRFIPTPDHAAASPPCRAACCTACALRSWPSARSPLSRPTPPACCTAPDSGERLMAAAASSTVHGHVPRLLTLPGS